MGDLKSADEHRHSSPCDIHEGKCLNPYHIAEPKTDELSDVLAGFIQDPFLRKDATTALRLYVEKAVLKGRIDELELLIGSHNNDPSINRYDVLTIARSVLNERRSALNKELHNES